MNIYIPTWLAWYLLGVLTPILVVFTLLVVSSARDKKKPDKKKAKDENSPHK